jgi:hypothetical protein
MSETLNTDGMSLAQIKELAEQEAQAAANPEPVEETVYQRRVVDSDGVERTYEGDTPESLVDAIVEGRAAHQPAKVEPVRERTADEEFVLAQEFASSPSKAFKKMSEEHFGMSSVDVKAKLQKLTDYEAAQSAEDYVAKHPEYHAIPANGTRIQQAMREANLPITLSNIEKTVAELDSKGLIVHKPKEFDPYSATLAELRAKTLGQPVENFDEGF